MLESQPDLHTLDLAEKFQVPEGKFSKIYHRTLCLSLRASGSPACGNPHLGRGGYNNRKSGSIFEVSGVFPQGKTGYGYFNLNMDKQPDIALHGHLKLDRVKDIALISKPFRGKESYAIAFITEDDNILFKIYLGRDTQRQLFPHQVEKFNQLKNKEILC